jgi:hypothetical protein
MPSSLNMSTISATTSSPSRWLYHPSPINYVKYIHDYAQHSCRRGKRLSEMDQPALQLFLALRHKSQADSVAYSSNYSSTLETPLSRAPPPPT